MKPSYIVILGAVVLSMAQHHNHLHRHLSERASPAEKNEKATTVQAQTSVVTVYMLNGQKISSNEVDSCLKESRCVIVDNKLEAASPPPSPSADIATSSSSQASSVPEKALTPAATSSAAVPEPAVSTSATLDNLEDQKNDKSIAKEEFRSDIVNLIAVNRNFPSGVIDCSEFPSAYGAVAADWIGLQGWTGVQKTPGYSLSVNAISEIETAIAGEGCVPGSFCSYACPAGYQKSQWPSAQGSTGQSIGGLFCNHNGKLELSRLSKKQLCTPGVGNISVKNSHKRNVAICRTDYPGTEAETIALNALPGSTVKVTCPDSKEYYRTWENAPTSAQYYINPSGYGVKEACTWGNSGTNLGNWAPVNMGVGKGDSGSTYVSLFPNAPTNPNGVLDFNIEIKGDVTGACSYKNGKYYKDGVPSPTGCTVGVHGQAVFEFS